MRSIVIAILGPGSVQELEGEYAFGGASFEGGEGFGGDRAGGGSLPATTMIRLPWPGDFAYYAREAGEGD